MKLKRRYVAIAVAGLAAAGVAVAATLITVKTPFKLSDGVMGDKPKLQRMGDGTLLTAYGDSPAGAGMVYDVKAAEERTARDIFVKTCNPKTAPNACDSLSDWSAAINVSNSALQTSTGTFDWRGTLGAPSTYPGDTDKANIKTNGSVIVLTWVGKYCPDGDLGTAGLQASVQRGIQYLARDSRVIPFSCTWMSYSTNKGALWSTPQQLSTGERDAIQDASSGAYDSTTKLGRVNISWQEDPQGLQLGDADGPGDGASGANVNGGTDVWYAHAGVDLNQTKPAKGSGSEYSTAYFNLQPAVRMTDNWTGSYGVNGSVSFIYDGTGLNLDGTTAGQQVEKGQAGAARPNIGMVGTTAIVAYEETKGSMELDSGKFIRYHAFPYNTPLVAGNNVGCIISDPVKNARRVRFLTQSPADAGPGGIQLGIFWKEGSYDKGGPSDIRVRRGMGGLQPGSLVPAVDAACATSSYATAIALTSAKGENISSKAPSATVANLTDDTELNYTENALAHRGVLRGTDMWIGYSYTSDLVKLWAQLDNYNFWIRKFTVAGGWENPKNVTNIDSKSINVREPRIFGTPKSDTTFCPTGNATDPSTTDATFCQNTGVVYLAWGTQTNVSPYVPEGGQDLGEFVTVSMDSAATFATPVKLSKVQGVLWGDDESAYESQPLTRPDGTRFYAVWNQKNLSTLATYAEYTSGDLAQAADPVSSSSSGGCTTATGQAPFDPMLPALAALGLIGLGLRRQHRKP